MTVSELLKNIENVEGRLFFIYGNEAYLNDKAFHTLIKKCTPPPEELNLKRSEGAVSIPELVAMGEQLPFMAEKSVVAVRDAAFLREGDASSLVKYLPNASPTTIFIFAMRAEPDKRRGIIKYLLKEAVCVDASPLSPVQLESFITAALKRQGVRIEKAAAARLLELAGKDMYALSGEVDKLAALKKLVITEADVLAHASASTEYSAFMLHDLMLAGRLAEAKKLLADIYLNEKTYIPLVSLIANKWRYMYFAARMLAAGDSPHTAAAKLEQAERLHPYPAKLAAEECRRFRLGKLRSAQKELADYDLALKSGRADIGMMALLIKLYCEA